MRLSRKALIYVRIICQRKIMSGIVNLAQQMQDVSDANCEKKWERETKEKMTEWKGSFSKIRVYKCLLINLFVFFSRSTSLRKFLERHSISGLAWNRIKYYLLEWSLFTYYGEFFCRNTHSHPLKYRGW